jgi:hypothetical protein
MVKSLFVRLLLVVATASTISACCTSITCNVKKMAAEDLVCSQSQVKVENITDAQSRAKGDFTRQIKAAGCGKTGNYTCQATNADEVVNGPKKYGLLDISKNALDLEWQCQRSEATASAMLK